MLERRGRRWTLAGCGVLRAAARASLAEKLLTLHTGLLALLDHWQPQEAAVEDLFHARNARAALVLGQARGVLLLGLCQRGLSPHSYAPRFVKLAVAGSGAADKERVREWIRRDLGPAAERIPMDASDALAVALCHAHSRNFRRAVAAPGARHRAALR